MNIFFTISDSMASGLDIEDRDLCENVGGENEEKEKRDELKRRVIKESDALVKQKYRRNDHFSGENTEIKPHADSPEWTHILCIDAIHPHCITAIDSVVYKR